MLTAQSLGICEFCGKEQKKAAMSRHLSGCPSRPKGEYERLALLVEGANDPAYWLHLDLAPKATLADLDAFLRDIWLECCGHLSAFRIGDRDFQSSRWGDDDLESDAEHMDARVLNVLPPGTSGKYVYDFGSSTHLKIRAVGTRFGEPMRETVILAARNAAPVKKCSCGKRATGLCAACGKAICPAHAEHHRCGSEMLLPVLNSPRAGVCGYTG